MTQLETTCLLYENHIRAFRAFAAAYPEVLDDRALAILSDRPFLLLYDAALAGKVLGTEGWTRKRNPYCTSGIAYDWTRAILGINVKIEDAETQNDMDKTPVPPKAFPLALEEASPSAVEAASSPQTEEDDIPF